MTLKNISIFLGVVVSIIAILSFFADDFFITDRAKQEIEHIVLPDNEERFTFLPFN